MAKYKPFLCIALVVCALSFAACANNKEPTLGENPLTVTQTETTK